MTPEYDPPAIALPATRPNDPRIGHLLGAALARGGGREVVPRVVILGFPCDEGVARNGGRRGAAGAPDEIRRYLYRLTPPSGNPAFRDLLAHTRDLGNLQLSGRLEEDQDALGEACRSWFREGVPVVILGGGHETSFGHFLGYAKQGLEVEIVNWDAHADVRELKDGRGHSGSPFRQALEHPSGCCRSYHLVGWLPHCNAEEHLEFVRGQGGNCIGLDDLEKQAIGIEGMEQLFGPSAGCRMVSFDLDLVDQAYAPGVSAPATGGMDSRFWLHAVRLAGRWDRVTSVDFVEVNPLLDRDGQTARLAALGVWNFLLGLSDRPA